MPNPLRLKLRAVGRGVVNWRKTRWLRLASASGNFNLRNLHFSFPPQSGDPVALYANVLITVGMFSLWARADSHHGCYLTVPATQSDTMSFTTRIGKVWPAGAGPSRKS
jgi:hypothetical protein